jgi:hypothetical protein
VSEEETFLERWARRKRDAAKTTAADVKDVSDREPDDEKRSHAGAAQPDCGAERTDARRDAPVDGSEPAPAFDLAKLPSLDSITAETDIRAFLQPGVPAQLSRAALRRAWSADPAIRDFVGLADYDWDFNTEGAILGFGPLEMTEDLRRRVTEMVGRSFAPDEPEPTEPDVGVEQTAAAASGISEHAGASAAQPNQPGAKMSSDESGSDQLPLRDREDSESSSSVNIASQQSAEPAAKEPQVIAQRHGRALPI